MKSQIKKSIAILLAVCFLVSLTAVAVNAVYASGEKPDNPKIKRLKRK